MRSVAQRWERDVGLSVRGETFLPISRDRDVATYGFGAETIFLLTVLPYNNV
jgi:hypothetical protein